MKSMNPSLESRFAGAMLGTFVGDALGQPFEGARPQTVAELWEQVAAGGKFVPRRYTDDTQMMIGLAESLVACGGVDPAHMANCFAANFEEYRGYGAPIAAPIRAPNGKAFAPNAPMGHVIPMTENLNECVFGKSVVCVRDSKELIRTHRRIGAIGADDDRAPPTTASDIPETIHSPIGSRQPVNWFAETEHPDLSPSVIELARRRDGWQPESWREYLLDRADRCEAVNPNRAQEFRQAAALMAPDLVNG